MEYQPKTLSAKAGADMSDLPLYKAEYSKLLLENESLRAKLAAAEADENALCESLNAVLDAAGVAFDESYAVTVKKVVADLAAARAELGEAHARISGYIVEIDILTNQLHEGRQRHAEVVEAAYKEGFDHIADALAGFVENPVVATINIDAAWLASDAKARLT